MTPTTYSVLVTIMVAIILVLCIGIAQHVGSFPFG